ncbi:PstS family phosphate ABC transporter substrate-binding protein [Halobacteriaceae bacterium SHR40]|uniref:PstS family phosphate ABC transporter substrate-binding protein n=1 Tax=Halovenus amylolytica TaxID=2500550 RepID=UPI000FE3F93F
MADQNSEVVSGATRRKFLTVAGSTGALALAGCTESSSDDDDSGSDDGSSSDGGSTNGGDSLSGVVEITGSSTVFPVSDTMAENFMDEHPDVNVTVDSTGSGGGFDNHFCPGQSDLNGASRPISDQETEQCTSNDVQPVEFEIAQDALTMAVNNDNDWVDCMTFDEMSQIWREDGVENWSDIRDEFPDEPFELYGPADTSGTYDWFNANVIGEEYGHTTNHEPTEEDDLIVQGIRDNVAGMGYFGYAYYSSNEEEVKALDVRASEDDPCGSPGLDTAKEGTYPMARPLFIYANEEQLQRDEFYEFMRFYLEEAEKDLVSEIGYVPSNADMVEENLQKLDEAAGR